MTSCHAGAVAAFRGDFVRAALPAARGAPVTPAQLGPGLDRFAATKRIQLRRTDAGGQQRLYLFNYRAVESGGSIEAMITLREGDVLLVPERRLFE